MYSKILNEKPYFASMCQSVFKRFVEFIVELLNTAL